MIAGMLALLAITILSGSNSAPMDPNNRQQPLRIPLQSMRIPFENADAASDASGVVPVALIPDQMMLVGTVSVGSPAQPLPVWFQTHDEEFYFLDVNGTGANTSRYDYT